MTSHFSFDEGNAILYVKLARLREDSVGRFVMLLVHTLAHIKAQDLDNDADPTFAAEFYKGLATLCDDLFFSRYKGGKADEINHGRCNFPRATVAINYTAEPIISGVQSRFESVSQKYIAFTESLVTFS